MIDVQKLLAGDRRTLAKAITLIESSKSEDQKNARDLLQKILPHTGKSFRLGITGSPGVGKSTFIEHFGLFLISQKKKVAVLAIDPSSPTSGGSILGDKTRMEKLANDENSFIRPTPSSGNLGGVAQKTREVILLCEAAGYDYIVVETVGVGQSEYEVASMVDFFMLLILPSGGDELQGIKKGILELADLILVNKCDGENINLAKQTLAQYQSALQITAREIFWKTEIILNSSILNPDFKKIVEYLDLYKKLSTENFFWTKKREEQNLNWFNSLIKELVWQKIKNDKNINKLFEELSNKIQKKASTPLDAAYEIANKILK